MPEKRTMDSRVPQLSQVMVTNTLTGLTAVYPYVVPRIGQYKTIEGNWAGRFKPGQFRLNDVKILTDSTEVVPGYVKLLGKSGPYVNRIVEIVGDHCFNAAEPALSSIWDDNLYKVSSCKANARTKQSETDIGEFLGEFRETVEFLKNPIKALTSELEKVAHKRNPLNVLADGWLSYRYGLLPLMSDAQNLINIANGQIRRNETALCRKTAGATKTSTQLLTTSQYASDVAWDTKVDVVTTQSSHTSFYYQQLMECELYSKLRALGLMPEQLPNLMWQLTKFSFVVDWFVNVSWWLQAITPDPHLRFLGNSTSQKSSVTRTTYPIGNYRSAYMDVKFAGPSKRIRSYEFLERRVNGTTPVIPAFNPKFFNLKRTIDSAAMLWRPIRKIFMR